MGSVCMKSREFRKRDVAPDEHYDLDAAPKYSGAECRVLIIAIDYLYDEPGGELQATIDGDNFQALCDECGATDVTYLKELQATKQNVTAKIREITARCEPGDYFVFYYSGHGMSIADDDGDEEDGFDEAFCFLTPQGKSTVASAMKDDEFVQVLSTSLPEDVYCVVIADCCHSATICDLQKPSWGDHKVVCISGCADDEESINLVEYGGILTHCLLKSIAQFSDRDMQYSCSQLYNKTVENDQKYFESGKDVSLSMTHSINGAENMAWPLLPLKRYASPHYKGGNELNKHMSDMVKEVDKVTPQILREGKLNPLNQKFIP